MQAKTYIGITPEKFQAICRTAKEKTGVDFHPMLQGQATGSGLTISWDYNPDAHTLTVQCLTDVGRIKAFFIESKLDALVASA